MSTKFCRDCKHHQALGLNSACARYKELDVVTGKMVQHPVSAHQERGQIVPTYNESRFFRPKRSTLYCGPAGTLFEPREKVVLPPDDLPPTKPKSFWARIFA